MSLGHLIQVYGYVAVFFGTFFEGETVLILGGFAARRGYLSLPWVVFVAFLGTLLCDQLFFFLGRFRRQAFLVKRPKWQRRTRKAGRLLEIYHLPVILGFRFLYGLRLVFPFMIGMSRIHILRFIILNIIGAAIWASIIGTAGYFFGVGLEAVIGDLKKYELKIMLGVIIAGLFFWILHHRMRRVRMAKDGNLD